MRTHMKWRWAVGILTAAALVLAVSAFGVTTHSALLIGVLLLCPLMMLFMGHGGQKGPEKHPSDVASASPETPSERPKNDS